jgi:pyruvate/2-oxoglutarate dehydrogenase complex dihydrolipoamide dehydrogenase (E3) component
MPADYDLVVVGGALEGRIAAIAAINYGARVALVEPPGLFDQHQQKRYLLQALQQLGQGQQQQAVVQRFQRSSAAVSQKPWDWSAILAWSAIASQTQSPELSPAAMSASGIDVVLEMPERLSQQGSRQLIVTTATRRLQSRGIIAAFGTVPLPLFSSEKVPAPTGIEPLLAASKLPEALTLWGDCAEAVMWAEALSQMGSRVTLVSDCFLSYEDADIGRLVRSRLTALGVKIISSSAILNGSNTHRQDLAKNSLLLGRGQPALVLPEFVYQPIEKYPDTDAQKHYQQSGQGHSRTYLFANERLQTRHPRVFACGSLLSSFPIHKSVAQAEAQTAVRNALFLPNRHMRYKAIPEGFHHFARVGLTPRFVRKGYPPNPVNAADWEVWTASSPNSTDLSQISPFPSYCKLIFYKGRLQSVHLLGEGASELIQPLATMIGQPASAIMRAVEGSPVTGLADLVRVAVGREGRFPWKASPSHWQPGHWRRDWAENWFNWRRS